MACGYYLQNYSMMKTIFLSLAALFLFQALSRPQTAVPTGSVSGTWTREGSPYNIEGNILIADGTTLAINPGVTVNFGGLISFCGGPFACKRKRNGFDILYSSRYSNGWKGIRFDNTPETNDSSRITYCRVEFGKTTGNLLTDRGGAFYFSHFSKAVISHCVIANGGSEFQGGAIFCEYSSPVISYNTIVKNTTADGGGAICFQNSSSPVISNNTISYNVSTTKGGGGIYGSGGNAIISDNTIIYNEAATVEGGGGGIYMEGDQIVITRNRIAHNKADAISGGGGIYCTGSNPVISYNTISNNESLGSAGGGGGISLNSTASPVISNNIITNNRTLSIFGGGGGIYSAGVIRPLTTIR